MGAPPRRHQSFGADTRRGAGATDARRSHPRPPVRTRGDSRLGTQPAALRPHAGDQPCRPDLVRLRRPAGEGTASRLEAAAGSAAPRGRAAERHGGARALRQGRHRVVRRGAQVRRARAAAGISRPGGHAPARRARGYVDGSQRRPARVHRPPARHPGPPEPRLFPARPAAIRAEATARRGARCACRAPARHRPARTARDTGRLLPGRSGDPSGHARRMASHQGPASGARRAGPRSG